ncbi:MAG TPA: 16S rRNA (guanine(966)-N(2))-methyltransferase RsmD [Dehalococcoidia bacterium]|jgi:16S rRNA (guanine966-N2)-methyltransferase
MPIRIIGGEASGRVLKGLTRPGTRPTSDRVREALFAILESHGSDLTRVLDLYSGTGAMGIEALSRGAEHCDFVEADARACDVIKANLRATGYASQATVHCATVARAAGRLAGPYTLVVADPPYEYDRAESELAGLLERGLLAPAGTLAVEHSKRKEWPEALGGRQRLLMRRHGDSALTVYT